MRVFVGWEAALFVRLHVLQGITAYHQGHIERSKFLIGKVEEEVARLQVSDEQLVELISLGNYSIPFTLNKFVQIKSVFS